MRLLALDSALACGSAAVVLDDHVAAMRETSVERGAASRLPVMAAAVLREAGLEPAALNAVAVTIGPGSFTGIRAALALAHGIGLAAGIPVIGVTVGEACAEALPHLGRRQLWTVIDSKRSRVFLERAGTIASVAAETLPWPGGPVAVAGDAAVAVAAQLAARGVDVMLTDVRRPQPKHVAMAARRRADGGLPPRAAQPVYVDPPAARLPAHTVSAPPFV
jgi:tRNA threonylcarbamoyladenosine biosynthesis protein TsaB